MTVPAPVHDPQGGVERRLAARHMLAHPLTCKEHDPEIFAVIRRHATTLDRWFTQRLGYRLHVDADTARLHKTGYVPDRRPLRTHTDRGFTPVEYVLLALVLAATAAGPSVLSLRDLVDEVRSAAVEAGIGLGDEASDRRALATVLKWMINRGLAAELHETVDRYASDETADAVLRLRPDRIALLPLPALVDSVDPASVLTRAARRDATRQWLRCRLVEDPVVYQMDLTDAEWSELRRRLGDEEQYADEMFGLAIEVRSEGVALVDPDGSLSEERFPAGGTTRHAALLLIERLWRIGGTADEATVRDIVAELAAANDGWARDKAEAPHRLAAQVAELLCDLRLAERDGAQLRLLPAAARFTVADAPDPAQEALW